MQAEYFLLPGIVCNADNQLVPQPFVEICAEDAKTSDCSKSINVLCNSLSLFPVSLTEDDLFSEDVRVLLVVPTEYVLDLVVSVVGNLVRPEVVDDDLLRFRSGLREEQTSTVCHDVSAVGEQTVQTELVLKTADIIGPVFDLAVELVKLKPTHAFKQNTSCCSCFRHI